MKDYLQKINSLKAVINPAKPGYRNMYKKNCFYLYLR